MVNNFFITPLQLLASIILAVCIFTTIIHISVTKKDNLSNSPCTGVYFKVHYDKNQKDITIRFKITAIKQIVKACH